MCDRLADGLLVGVDRSATMVAAATARNAAHVAAGRARFVCGPFDRAGVGDEPFDTIYAFHVADFRRRPGPMLGAARARLRPGGSLHLFDALPGWDGPAPAAAFAAEIGSVLAAHGFQVGEPVVDRVASGVVVAVRATVAA